MDAQPRLIRFPCKCGHRFAVSQDMAAGVVQCPKCGLLADVPALSDLQNLADDGTLLVQPAARRAEPGRLGDLNRFYGRDHLDELGNEKDLRPTFEDLEAVDSDVGPIDVKDAGPGGKPKAGPRYDPVTGELIRPIEVGPQPVKFAAAGDMAPGDIPVAGVASLTYAPARPTLARQAWRIPVEMLMPSNVIVLLILFVVHFLNQIVFWAMAGGFHFILPAAILLVAAIFSHYGNVVEETGPGGVDEIPRPGRGMSFSEDVWKPLFAVTVAAILCYAPAWAVVNRAADERVALVVGGALFLAGTVFFPAVLLTTTTSGALNNLRPDRLLGVVRASGWAYAGAVGLWVLALGAYLVAMASSVLFTTQMGQLAPVRTGVRGFMSGGAFVYPMLMAAVFAAHWFCWQLGLLYRHHHGGFPWVLQRHISTRRKTEAERAAEMRARRRKPMYVTPKIQAVRKVEGDGGGQ